MHVKIKDLRQFQKVNVKFGVSNDKKKKVWLDVTDEEFFLEDPYFMKEPPTCAFCLDKNHESCVICNEDI